MSLDAGGGRTGAGGPRAWVCAAIAWSLLAAGGLAGQDAPTGAGADGGSAWFPDRTSFAPLLAAPREVALRGSFLAADRSERPGDFAGTNLEADVALGHRLPVRRLREAGDGPELSLGLEVGVFTRFFMETAQKDLISADFRVGAPLSGRWGRWAGRLALLHVSGHLGDDFVDRFGAPSRQVTRDGFELLVARRLERGLRVYGGGEWNFHVNEGVERAAARAGAEWDPDPASGPGGDAAAGGSGHGADPGGAEDGGAPPDRPTRVRAWPFAAGEARLTSLTEEVAASASAGLALRVEGVVLRLEAQLHAGPTALAELRGRDETAAGVGLRVEP